MDVKVNKKRDPGDKTTRIQEANRRILLEAALDVFSAYGFRGTTIDQIAEKAGMSKPNLLYYFKRKQDIYAARTRSARRSGRGASPLHYPQDRHVIQKARSLAPVRQRNPAWCPRDQSVPDDIAESAG